MSKPRFSKQALIDELDSLIEHYEKEDGFRRDTGWNQVRGKGEGVNRDYGMFDAYSHVRDMIENWGLLG